MKKTISTALIILFITAVAYAGEKAPQKVYDLANSKLAKYGTDPLVVKSVSAENAKGKSIEQIKDMDKKWITTPGIADYMKELMTSECGKHLIKIKDSAPYFAEIFLTDNQGANVCQTDKTSDYWQGDEKKFTESFRSGEGTVFVDEVKLDESTQEQLVHVSVPVKEEGKTTGVLIFGVQVSKLQ